MSPGHRHLSAWYQQVAQQLEAGVPFADAIRLSPIIGVSASEFDAVATRVERGGSIDAALAGAAAWLPLADRLVLAASAAGGRMPQALRALAARHDRVDTAQRRMLLACLYPLALLHLGLLLIPLSAMIDWEKGFTWSSAAYARGLMVTLGPLWAAIALGWFLIRRRTPLAARIGGALPFIGGYLRAQALADLAFILGNLLEAGMPIGRAWATVGAVTLSPALKIAAADLSDVVDRGAAPGSKLGDWTCFPRDFVAAYRTGEATGQLDENLRHLAARYQDTANRALAASTMLYPAVLFLFSAGMAGYFVVTLYRGYLKMIVGLADS